MLSIMQAQRSLISKALAANLFFSCFAQGTALNNPRSSQPIPVSPRVVPSTANSSCHYLPGDASYPTEADWNTLNDTVGGKLIQGVPLATVCYGVDVDTTECSSLKEDWSTVDPFIDNPVNIMSPYWLNDTCSPYLGPSGSCTEGNLAVYAIDVSEASDIIAGVQFAKEKNIRLVLKNTGHDYLGRSSGKGSLALWTHNLKGVSFFNYTSSFYTGPAAKVGAGIEVSEAYNAASENGLRLTGGGCPTVGLAGGWLPGGGHGPLEAAYGLGADNALEFEVVTTTGEHLTASPTQNEDLYWALSGGGSGNYAIVLSVTVKAHPDGPVAGSALLFYNTNPDSYWSAISAWLKHLLVLDVDYPNLKTAVTLTNEFFYLDFATLPDATEAELLAALDPFTQELETLNITLSYNETAVQPTFAEHYEFFGGTATWATNITVGSRLIPRSLIQNNLEEFVNTMRSIANENNAVEFVFVAANVTHEHVGNEAGSNSVLPAWRDALFLLNFGEEIASDASWEELKNHQAQANQWHEIFKALTPNGGSYLNEGLYDDPDWKWDYFGDNYDKLESIKAKYDPDFLLWSNTAVGNDVAWEMAADGRLCPK
ncbi:6-hydroxy-D-nicotine oxidase [Cytospora mali]|uniref:6-hydroxy-D-nicotine oxidase n=1 Tax=Cytospora mali TaxID=578113 RepID=A0A194VMN8_CYTMA|nr:6-hydroxy-D-nicotine oxidase [Valsa mali]